MVPSVACLLLALTSTSAAADLLIRRTLRGPYRHGRRDESAPYPLGTGSVETAVATVTLANSPPGADGGIDSFIPDAISHSTSLPLHGTTPSLPDSYESAVLAVSSSGTRAPTLRSSYGQQPYDYTPGGLPSDGLHLRPTGHAPISGTGRHSPPRPYFDAPTAATLNGTSNTRSSTASHGGERPQNTTFPDASNNRSLDGTAYAITRPSAFIILSHKPYGSDGPPVHRPSGTSPSFNPPRPTPLDDSCAGATLNIPNASVDYWYSQTYYQEESTFLIEYNENATSTGWTLLPASETFNVTSALDVPTCISSLAYNTDLSETMWELSCFETPTPVAAATTTVEQTAYKPINRTTSKGSIPNVVVTPSPAKLTVDATTVSSHDVPVIHFSQYEIVRRSPMKHYNGTVRCMAHTEVHNLPKPTSFQYQGVDVNQTLAVGKLGKMNAALLQALDDSDVALPKSVSLGSFVAAPTVVVVVEKVVVAAQAVMGNLMGIGAELETPTATLPSGLSFQRTTPTETGKVWVPVTPRVESSAKSLLVPTTSTKKTTKEPDFGFNVEGPSPTPSTRPGLVIAPYIVHVENSALTLAIPVDPTKSQNVVTADFNGRVVTATRASGSVDVRHLLTAVVSAAQPSNAEEVLSNALQTFPANPIASAIASGIGGLRPNRGSSSGANSDFRPSNGGAVSGGSRSPVLTIGGAAVTATRSSGSLVIDGRFLKAGGAPATIAGTVVSVLPGATAVAVGGTTTSIGTITNPGAAANIPIITVGSEDFTANAATQYNILGATLTPGGQVVVHGSTISLGPSAVSFRINDQLQTLSPAAITPAPLLTYDGTIYRPNIGSTYNIVSQLLTPGGQIVVSGKTLSLAADSGKLIVNGMLQPAVTQASPLATITAPPTLKVNGRMFAPDAGTSYVIGGQTLIPVGRVTLEGTTFSLNSAANQLVTIKNGHTITSYIGMVGAAAGGAPVLTINGNIYNAVDYHAAGATYIIEGQTLIPGGTITVFDSTISLARAGTALVMQFDGTTTTSHISGAYGVRPTAAPILTIGEETFTAINDDATYIIDNETLTPSGTATVVVDGQTYSLSLAPHATLLEIIGLESNGHAYTTLFETLFPATARRVTGTDPTLPDATQAIERSSPTNRATATGSEDAGFANVATSLSLASTMMSALVGMSPLIVVALWL